MHVALDTWGMADICGTAVDLYVEYALGVNDTVANNYGKEESQLDATVTVY